VGGWSPSPSRSPRLSGEHRRQRYDGGAVRTGVRPRRPADSAAALDWPARARILDGKPAAGSTQRRKRSVFCNALGYAVEQGHLAPSPVDRLPSTTPAVAAIVDCRVVVSSARARVLLADVRSLACLYYAALRPSEAVMLRAHTNRYGTAPEVARAGHGVAVPLMIYAHRHRRARPTPRTTASDCPSHALSPGSQSGAGWLSSSQYIPSRLAALMKSLNTTGLRTKLLAPSR
jgi:hypothetical protein